MAINAWPWSLAKANALVWKSLSSKWRYPARSISPDPTHPSQGPKPNGARKLKSGFTFAAEEIAALYNKGGVQ
jgi:hypothetical protein